MIGRQVRPHDVQGSEIEFSLADKQLFGRLYCEYYYVFVGVLATWRVN